LIENGQGGDVYRHVYGHAGGTLDQLGIGAAMAWVAEWRDVQQYRRDPGRLETLSELAGNQAGRDVGRILKSLYGSDGHVGENADFDDARSELLDILCGQDGDCEQ
jgi:hypothetical protein